MKLIFYLFGFNFILEKIRTFLEMGFVKPSSQQSSAALWGYLEIFDGLLEAGSESELVEVSVVLV